MTAWVPRYDGERLGRCRVHQAFCIVRRDSPGVLPIPSSRSIGAAIEGLSIVWLTWTPEELRNVVRGLP